MGLKIQYFSWTFLDLGRSHALVLPYFFVYHDFGLVHKMKGV